MPCTETQGICYSLLMLFYRNFILWKWGEVAYHFSYQLRNAVGSQTCCILDHILIGVSTFSLESSSPESAMHSELHLCTLPSKEEEIAGLPVASVLQAFAILGELRTKLKSFGKTDLVSTQLLQP